MINICNHLLTRRCDLSCNFCRITKDYKEKPKEYPKKDILIKNESSTEFIIETLRRLKLNNHKMFHIFYGGEPLLRCDLPQIIKYCNENEIFYTIISNVTKKENRKIIIDMANTIGIKGLSFSIDPIIYSSNIDIVDKDRYLKSLVALNFIDELNSKCYIEDLVAEITCDRTNFNFLPLLVKELTNKGVYSSITFIDVAKSNYYDFSNIEPLEYEKLLIENNEDVKLVIDEVIDDRNNLLVHMKNMVKEYYKLLPSNFDCEIDKNLHNLTIDSDGTVRLCLRIRGCNTPHKKILEYIDKDGNINNILINSIIEDKSKYCLLCNWTCVLQSKQVEDKISEQNDILHI